MHVSSTVLDNAVALVQAEGSANADEGVEPLIRAIERAIVDRRNPLIIDLAKVTYLSSGAIGALLRAHVTYTRKHWQYRICGLNDRVYTILAITKLNRILFLQDTLDQARRSLA